MRFANKIASSALCMFLLAANCNSYPAHAYTHVSKMDVVQQTMENEIMHAKKLVYPALVNIFVVFRYYDGGRAHLDLAGGSGVIVSPDGYVITNYHVAAHTTHIVCTLANHKSYTATDIYNDPLTDLSVLKLQLPKSPHPIHLPYAVLGDSSNLQAGQFVLAMGNPLMLSSSLSFGVISNPARVFTNFTGTDIEDQQLEDGQTTGLLTRWIQHDALILPGNSGGPLVNMDGQVIGINELGGDGMGFAIPSNIVKSVYKEVRHTGTIVRGTLGISPEPVKKMGRTTGTLVAAVIPESPAALCGIQPGDVILSINGQPTNTLFFEQVPLFFQIVAKLHPGSTATIRFLRGSTIHTARAKVTTLEPSEGKERQIPVLGITASNITPFMALTSHLPNTNGVMITGIRPGYPVEEAHPKPQEDDVITALDGISTPNPTALEGAIKNVVNHKHVVMSYLHNNEKMLAVLNMQQNNSSDSDVEIPQAWMGIKTEVLLPQFAKTLHLTGKNGFLVTEVLPFTTAAGSGLKVGDVITALNGTALDATNPADEGMLMQQIQNMNVGDIAKLSVIRNNKTIDIPVKLQNSPTTASEAKSYTNDFLQCTVRNITIFDRISRHWDASQKGVIVSNTTEGGWANVGGLREGDLILSINGKQITDVNSFKSEMKYLEKSKPKVITMYVRHHVLTNYIFIEPQYPAPGSDLHITKEKKK